jgi:hypothetical protein
MSRTQDADATHQAIPEAKALKFDELLDPTREAMKELFRWLQSACENSATEAGPGAKEQLVHEHEQVATSLLISGDRGAGKTTVLLTAAYALDVATQEKGANRNYFEGDTELKNILEEVHGRVVWLETLDLEPLPASANLLATLLVRIRQALEPKDTRKPRTSYSFLENRREVSESLYALVEDATFMWEEGFAQQDPRRERAEQQITAAGLYASFPREFRRVMKEVSDTLKSADGSERVLVLPIDNVDRSIDHIANIAKLIRMATSRRLWFVLAAARPDFQLFLERSFQNELLRAANIISGEDPADQTQSIARRQAATAMRRSVPRCYQIEIEPVKAEQAWHFPYTSSARDAGKGESLNQLLARIPLPKNARFHIKTKESRLRDLLDVKERMAEKDQEAHLTPAAQMGLTLSARSVQDLHTTLVRNARNPAADGESAVLIAVQMLSNAIDESSLPFWASQTLLRRVLRKDSSGRWVLDLTTNLIEPFQQKPMQQFALFAPMEHPAGDGHYRVLEKTLTCFSVSDIVLQVRDSDKNRSFPLPPDVAGWFMVLHDLLALFEEPRVLSERSLPSDAFPSLVTAKHSLLFRPSERDGRMELEFAWEPPAWKTFYQHFLLSCHWKAFLQGVAEPFRELRRIQNQAEVGENTTLQRGLVMLAWVEAVCSIAPVESETDQREGMHWQREDRLGRALTPMNTADNVATPLETYAHQVRKTIMALSERHKASVTGADGVSFSRASGPDWKWLTETLPQLILPQYSTLSTQSKEASDLLCWPTRDQEGEAEEKNQYTWEGLKSEWSQRQDFIDQRRYEAVARQLEKYYERNHEGNRALHEYAQERDAWVQTAVVAWRDTVEAPEVPKSPQPPQLASDQEVRH